MDLLEEIKTKTYTCFFNFLEYLNVDKSIFEHLMKLPIKIDKLEENTKKATILAIYNSDQNDITIERLYYKEILDKLNTLTDSQKDKALEKELLNDLCQTLCHEILHANRIVMIQDRLNVTNYAEKQSNLVERYHLQKEGYDINNCRLLLSEVINNKEFNNYQLIPFKINVLDYDLRILAYNKEKSGMKNI